MYTIIQFDFGLDLATCPKNILSGNVSTRFIQLNEEKEQHIFITRSFPDAVQTIHHSFLLNRSRFIPNPAILRQHGGGNLMSHLTEPFKLLENGLCTMLERDRYALEYFCMKFEVWNGSSKTQENQQEIIFLFYQNIQLNYISFFMFHKFY